MQSSLGDGRIARPPLDQSHAVPNSLSVPGPSPDTLPTATGAWSQQVVPISSLKANQRR